MSAYLLMMADDGDDKVTSDLFCFSLQDSLQAGLCDWSQSCRPSCGLPLGLGPCNLQCYQQTEPQIQYLLYMYFITRKKKNKNQTKFVTFPHTNHNKINY